MACAKEDAHQTKCKSWLHHSTPLDMECVANSSHRGQYRTLRGRTIINGEMPNSKHMMDRSGSAASTLFCMRNTTQNEPMTNKEQLGSRRDDPKRAQPQEQEVWRSPRMGSRNGQRSKKGGMAVPYEPATHFGTSEPASQPDLRNFRASQPGGWNFGAWNFGNPEPAQFRKSYTAGHL